MANAAIKATTPYERAVLSSVNGSIASESDAKESENFVNT